MPDHWKYGVQHVMEEQSAAPAAQESLVMNPSSMPPVRANEQQLAASPLSDNGETKPLYENTQGHSAGTNAKYTYMHLVESLASQGNNTKMIAFIGTESDDKPKWVHFCEERKDISTWRWLARHSIPWDETNPDAVLIRVEARGLRFSVGDPRHVRAWSSGWPLASSSGVPVGESPLIRVALPCAGLCQPVTVCPADDELLLEDDTFPFVIAFTLEQENLDVGEVEGEISSPRKLQVSISAVRKSNQLQVAGSP